LLEQFASSSDNSDVEELTWEDINMSRPFIAAFCMQYTPAEYQHEEKVRSAHASDGSASSACEGECGVLLPLTHTLLVPAQVVWRKIMWVVGTTITQTWSLVVTMATTIFIGIEKAKIPGVTTAVLKSVFICVNIGYSRHLLRRPYTSHRRSAQMGDPMCVL
jgi:hypothetical protein